MNTKQKLAIRLIMLCLRILKPWQYDHEFKPLIEEIEKTVKEAEI